jgi:signal transduction histidine kinase
MANVSWWVLLALGLFGRPSDSGAELFSAVEGAPGVEVRALSRRQLVMEEARLVARLQSLPECMVTDQWGRYGFHSALIPVEEEPRVQWLELDLAKPEQPVAMVLVPAVDPLHPEEGYGFPRRFSISISNSVMKSGEMVVDWRERDFPDPGRSPVLFSSDVWGRGDRFVVEVYEGGVSEAGLSFFALGEWIIYGHDLKHDPVQNLMQRPAAEVRFSGQYGEAGQWSGAWVADGVTGLGQPLGACVDSSAAPFCVVLSDEQLADSSPLLEMDLGAEVEISELVFFSRRFQEGLALPLYGFPLKMRVEFSNRPDFSLLEGRVDRVERPFSDAGLVRVKIDSVSARYLRLVAEELPRYEDQAVWSFEELVVWVGDKKVSEGVPLQYVHGAVEPQWWESLTDGVANGRLILDEKAWFAGLAERRLVERQLDAVRRELERLRVRSRAVWRGLGLLAGVGCLLAAVSFALYQRHLRRSDLLSQRRLIARELQDDVGSSLGSIALATEQLLQQVSDRAVAERLEEICYDANDAVQSLTEAIWVTNYGMITLEDLLYRFREHAWRVLPSTEVDLVIMGVLPVDPLKPGVKRHLNALFKVILHHFSRHAQATRVRIECSVHGGLLRLVVLDNGVGFDESAVEEGDGVRDLREQIDALGAHLRVDSVVGHGTTIAIEVPYEACVDRV